VIPDYLHKEILMTKSKFRKNVLVAFAVGLPIFAGNAIAFESVPREYAGRSDVTHGTVFDVEAELLDDEADEEGAKKAKKKPGRATKPALVKTAGALRNAGSVQARLIRTLPSSACKIGWETGRLLSTPGSVGPYPGFTAAGCNPLAK